MKVFKNSDGDHTNIIENLWTNLKTETRSRHEILTRFLLKSLFIEKNI